MKTVFEAIYGGTFGDCNIIHGLLESLANGGDNYITTFDFYHYIEAQQKADEQYRDYKQWTRMAIIGIAKSGFFSSDRTILEYCTDIWDIEKVPVPMPGAK